MKRVVVLYSVCFLLTLLVAIVAGLVFTVMFWTASGPAQLDPLMGFLASVETWFLFPWRQILTSTFHHYPTPKVFWVLSSLSWGAVLYFFHELLRWVESFISVERGENSEPAEQSAAANGAPRRPSALPLGDMSTMKQVTVIYCVCSFLPLLVAMVAIVASKVFIQIYGLLVGPPDSMMEFSLVNDRMWFFFPWRPTLSSNFNQHIGAPRELLVWVLSSLSWGAVLYLFHQSLQWAEGFFSD